MFAVLASIISLGLYQIHTIKTMLDYKIEALFYKSESLVHNLDSKLKDAGYKIPVENQVSPNLEISSSKIQ